MTTPLHRNRHSVHFGKLTPFDRNLHLTLLDNNAAGVPISGIIRAYNSLLIQPNPYFGAELNYYKSFRSAYDISFENDNYSDMTKAIGCAFDVNKALKEAIDFQTKNSFQTYIE